MGTIKLRRGSGSPAGSLAQYEVAMDVAARNLYTSSDGSDAVIIGQDVKYFLENNTISGITNVTTAPGEKAWFKNQNYTQASVNTGIAIARDLTSDGAVSGRDPRSAGLLWTVFSDAVNTISSEEAIYPGGITMESGSNDGSSPHWLRAFTYDDGISTFTEETLFDGTKDEFNIYPSTTINANSVIDGTAGSVDWGANSLGDSVLNIKTDNTGWWASQLSVEDSNGKVFSQVGQHSTGSDVYQWNITMDPDNTHGRTGVTTYPGDYFVDFQKDYSDPAAILMKQRVFGANDGFELSVHDDNNSNSPNPGPFGSPGSGYAGYGYKPFITNVEHFTVNAKDSDTSVAEALKVNSTAADFSVPVQLPNLTTTERNALTGAKGMTIYNTTEDRIEYYDGAWKYISGTAV